MSFDPRDTNHDGKVSLMEKVKDKMHHKNTTTTTTHTTAAAPLATAPLATHTTGILPTTAAIAPVNGAIPIIGYAAVPLAVTGAAMPLATTNTTAAAAAALPLATSSSSSIINTQTTHALPLASTGIASTSIARTGAYDSRDLNRDGVVSMSEKLAATHIGSAQQTEEARLRLHEEQLAISKREVGAGEVDIHKRVVEQHVSQTVAVRREEVIVERRPLSGVVDPNYRISAQDETMRVPLFREEIVTEKRVVPTEEVIVRKKEVIDQQTIGATLRSEHVETVQTTSSSAMLGSASSALLNNNSSSINNSNNNLNGLPIMNNNTTNIINNNNINNGSQLHDVRDTNFDGKVSLGEKVKGAIKGQKGPVIDSRDLNKDGKVSGEKVMSAARG